MLKKTAFFLVFFMAAATITAPVSMAGPPPPPPGYGHYYYRGPYHHGNGGEALFWGLTGLIFGSVLLSAVLQPPVQYVPQPYIVPRPQIYTYPPYVPPGMCRWERYLLDNYGRIILDQYGQPVLEYTLGSCQYPPPN